MTTPLDALAEALQAAAAFQQAAEAPPEAVLWCDPGREFISIVPALRARLPQVITLGDFDPATRTGPALWLRAVAARQVDGIAWPVGEPPIIYLPGYGREVLRGAEDCPAELAPLVWFAISGVFFGQPKQSRDWTLRAFLAAQGSPVNLNVPEDKVTREALSRAAPRLFSEPIITLAGKQWDSAALDGLLVEDPIADMLAWMDGSLTQEADPDRFEAFSFVSVKQFSFDPRKRPRQDAAVRLAGRQKSWAKVWDRFEERGGAYNGVVKLLEAEEPPQTDFLNMPVAYPKENSRREDSLRSALTSLIDQPAHKARTAVQELENQHGWRRATVWAKRGEARLAQALEHLVAIANAAPIPEHDPEAMASAYCASGWQADWSALTALELTRNGSDRGAVDAALRAIYLPWLNAGATALQALLAAGKLSLARPTSNCLPSGRTVVLFVDGLRMDVAHRLAALLRQRSATVTLTSCWSGFPTVTATCKPLVSPAAGLLKTGQPESLYPRYEGKQAEKPVLLKAIEAAGWTCSESLLGDVPVWLEGPSIDKAGEDNGAGMVALLSDRLTEITDTVMRLARQGRSVRIITDHGFLLMRGGLPHAALLSGLVEPSSKCKRVALLKEGAATGYPRESWSWDPEIQFVTPPGARTFYNSVDYAHGGISPQECILPVLNVTTEGEAKPISVTIRWRRMIVEVRVEGGEGLMADVRLGTDTSGETVLIKGPKPLDNAGKANLGVDLDYEGRDVCIVVYQPNSPQDVLAKLVTKAWGLTFGA
jgi:hypothetical protein